MHPKFKFYHDKIYKLYEENAEYRAAVNTTVENFILKLKKREQLFEVKKASNLSLKYVLEECAAACLWIETNCAFEVYPRPKNQPMLFIYNHYVKPNYPTLIKPLTLNFNKKVGKNTSHVY
jgi:hypothetical protein